MPSAEEFPADAEYDVDPNALLIAWMELCSVLALPLRLVRAVTCASSVFFCS